MPPQSGSITIMANDEPAAELLSCLRENLRELRVEISEPDGTTSGSPTTPAASPALPTY
jgi:hypothetical protein